MISCTEFIPMYSALFKYLEDRGGRRGVEKYWEHISDAYIKPRLGKLVEKHGLEGCFLYWAETLNEEAADFIMRCDEDGGEFSIDMRYCPSKGMLNKIEHIKPYYDYCGHCTVLYSRVLREYGIYQDYDLSKTDEAKCTIRLYKK